MNPKWLALVACVALAACGKDPDPKKEICANGVDDDANGLVDCSDSACLSDASCQVTPQDECKAQQECFGTHPISFFTQNDVLPYCTGTPKKCDAAGQMTDIRVDIDTTTYVGLSPRSVNTRFIKKVALDGTAVTCASLTGLFGDSNVTSTAIEDSKKFNLQAFDVNQSNSPGGTTLSVLPWVRVGGDFIVWLELWNGPRDANTGLATGKRYGYACLESGPYVAEILPADNHLNRSIKVVMPGPQNP